MLGARFEDLQLTAGDGDGGEVRRRLDPISDRAMVGGAE